MGRVRLTAIVVGLAFALPAMASASNTDLAGTWRSAPEELSLTTDFDESVWGKNAKSVRTVEMAVRANGEATLTVTRKVVDARGRTVKGSTSIEEARLVLGSARPTVADRSELAVDVTSAERRYPDDPGRPLAARRPARPRRHLRRRSGDAGDSFRHTRRPRLVLGEGAPRRP